MLWPCAFRFRLLARLLALPPVSITNSPDQLNHSDAMKTEEKIAALFGILNKAFNEGKLSNLKVARTIGGDCHIGFEWGTRQPFELHADFVFNECHLYLGFAPDEARIKSFAPESPLEEWRSLVVLMDDRLAEAKLFLSEVRDELVSASARA